MSRRTSRWISGSISGLAILLAILGLVASVLAIIASRDPLGLYTHQLSLPLIAIIFAALGPLVLAKHPSHPIGWIMTALGVFSGAVVLIVGFRAYGEQVLGPEHASWLAVVRWVDMWVWIPTNALPLTLLILLFPDGHLPSRRWRLVAWTTVVAMVGLTLGSALNPLRRMDSAGNVLEPNPFGIPGSGVAMDALLNVAGVLLVMAMLASIVSLVVRFQRSSGVERQQMKWLAYATVFLVVTTLLSYLLYAVLGEESLATQIGAVATSFGLLGIALAATAAILRYRLYDIDLIIYRTLVYGLLTGSVLLLYVGIVSLMGLLFETQIRFAGSLVATGVVAVLFQPLRERLQRGIRRLLYGERDEPYAVLTRLSRRLQATLQPEGALQTIVDTVAQALKLPYAGIALEEVGRFRVASSHGQPGEDRMSLPLTFQGEIVGQLIVSPRGFHEDFQRSEKALLEDIAHQAGVVVYGVRLTADLQRSRERLVTAREEERRRLRRELHDGLGPELAGLGLKLGAARNLIPTDPARADALLAILTGQVQEALAGIRRLAYDLRPPALDELGLVPAVRESANSQTLGGPHIVVVASPASLPPLPAAVEVAAYRIATEAVSNVARHAAADNVVIRFDLTDALEVTIQDDGVGLPEQARAGVGITSMRERAAELGGRVDVESVAGGGTRVRARLPLALAEA
jgi:signal transduction histidine kinase